MGMFQQLRSASGCLTALRSGAEGLSSRRDRLLKPWLHNCNSCMRSHHIPCNILYGTRLSVLLYVDHPVALLYPSLVPS